MRFAFSTLGCPELSFAEVTAVVREAAYDGIELRCARDAARPLLDVTDPAAIAGEVTVATVAAYTKVASPSEADGAIVAALRDHLRLAAALGADGVRVFPGGEPGHDDGAVRRLAAVAGEAEELGVRVLIETHDSHRAGADVARIIRRVGSPAIGAIWDVMHTWLAGEEPAASVEALGASIACVQLKDIASRDDRTPLPPGDGVLPLTECLAALHAAGWDGWVSWEYERAWHPDVPPLPGLAAEVRRRMVSYSLLNK